MKLMCVEPVEVIFLVGYCIKFHAETHGEA
jgi:hypothetical protein